METLSIGAKYAVKGGRVKMSPFHPLLGTKIAPVALDYESARTRLATRQVRRHSYSGGKIVGNDFRHAARTSKVSMTKLAGTLNRVVDK